MTSDTIGSILLYNRILDGWIETGRDKISTSGAQIGPTTQMKNRKIKEETNRQTDRIRQYKKKKCSLG
jgi:hypothetical protein